MQSRDNCNRNIGRFGTMSCSVLLQGSQVELLKCYTLYLTGNTRLISWCKTLAIGQYCSQIIWARPGFEPGTSRTRSANHTPRPTSLRWIVKLKHNLFFMLHFMWWRGRKKVFPFSLLSKHMFKWSLHHPQDTLAEPTIFASVYIL